AAFAQYSVAVEQSLVRIDDHLALAKAALFGCAVMTGVGAVVNTAKVEAGTAVVVVGLGGVGLSAVMGARAAGAGPIVAIDRLQSKLALARQFGATHAIDSTAADAFEQVRVVTGGGAHFAFECVGHPDGLATAYAVTRRGGTTVAVGLP